MSAKLERDGITVLGAYCKTCCRGLESIGSVQAIQWMHSHNQKHHAD